MLNETIGAAFRSSAMLIANDRVHLVPYRDQHQRASNISPAVTSVKFLRRFAHRLFREQEERAMGDFQSSE